MKVKGVLDEDFVNFKLPSMFISTCYCSFKCEKESGVRCCQNSALANQREKNLSDTFIIDRYLKNPITKAIVFGGLEPFNQFDEMFSFIQTLRIKYTCDDPVVIYTGFRPDEIPAEILALKHYKNIIVKFGRYVPDDQPHLDEVLGVRLSSSNQYAEQIS